MNILEGGLSVHLEDISCLCIQDTKPRCQMAIAGNIYGLNCPESVRLTICGTYDIM